MGKMTAKTQKSVRLNLDRSTLSVRAVRGPKDEGSAAKTGAENSENSLAHYTAHIFELNCPILFSDGLVHVIEGPDFRIFPPIQLHGGHSPSVPAKSVYIPSGRKVVDWAKRVDYTSCLGFVYSINQRETLSIHRGYGLRIDTNRGSLRATEIQKKFLHCARSISLQWWLLGSKNPYDLGCRFESGVCDDGNLSDIHDNGEPKYPMQSQAILSGIEQVIGQPHWQYLSTLADEEFPTDQPTSLFCDALDKFYSFDDASALLYAALSIEAAEYEVRKSRKINVYSDPIKNIKKNPQYLKYGDAIILKDLFVDRGHVAHAQMPPKLNSGTRSIKDYLIEVAKVNYARTLDKRGELSEDLQIVAEKT